MWLAVCEVHNTDHTHIYQPYNKYYNKTMKKEYFHPESKIFKVETELPIAFSKSGPGSDNEDPATKMREDLESDDEW